MYDMDKRSYFTTLGELRMLLADLPNETEVCTGGVLGSYLHFAKDKDLISFDDEDLDCDYSVDYPEYYDENEFYLQCQQIEEDEYCERQKCIDEGLQAFFVGKKLMRTFLADDGSWDYELYNITLTPVDSGQIGEGRDQTREDVTKMVLSWNHMENNKRVYFAPTEDFVELCENLNSNDNEV